MRPDVGLSDERFSHRHTGPAITPSNTSNASTVDVRLAVEAGAPHDARPQEAEGPNWDILEARRRYRVHAVNQKVVTQHDSDGRGMVLGGGGHDRGTDEPGRTVSALRAPAHARQRSRERAAAPGV